jgi:hypothetical protein
VLRHPEEQPEYGHRSQREVVEGLDVQVHPAVHHGEQGQVRVGFLQWGGRGGRGQAKAEFVEDVRGEEGRVALQCGGVAKAHSTVGVGLLS